MKTHSTILQWTISRTKKRLYNSNRYVVPCYTLALSGLVVCVAYMVQSMRPALNYGVVYSQLPILYEPIADPLDSTPDQLTSELTNNTAVAVLGLDAFIFGHLDSFTQKFYRADNKFRVPHADGAPDVGHLLDTYSRWRIHSNGGKKNDTEDTLILYPVAEMPMPVVIKVLHMLKESDQFNHVILATDLI